MFAFIATAAVGLVIAGVGFFAVIMSNREDQKTAAKHHR